MSSSLTFGRDALFCFLEMTNWGSWCIDVMTRKRKQHAYFLYYIDDSIDSDDSFDYQEYNDKYEKKYARYINVTYVPRILFENGKWKNTSIQEKYEETVKDEIGNDKFLSIIKKEIRYLR